jgi:hypothetical protein
MANLIVHILHRNCLPRYVIEWKTEGSLEVICRRGRRGKQLLDTLRKWKDAGNWKRKHYIALCGELALEDAMDLWQDSAEWMLS